MANDLMFTLTAPQLQGAIADVESQLSEMLDIFGPEHKLYTNAVAELEEMHRRLHYLTHVIA